MEQHEALVLRRRPQHGPTRCFAPPFALIQLVSIKVSQSSNRKGSTPYRSMMLEDAKFLRCPDTTSYNRIIVLLAPQHHSAGPRMTKPANMEADVCRSGRTRRLLTGSSLRRSVLFWAEICPFMAWPSLFLELDNVCWLHARSAWMELLCQTLLGLGHNLGKLDVSGMIDLLHVGMETRVETATVFLTQTSSSTERLGVDSWRGGTRCLKHLMLRQQSSRRFRLVNDSPLSAWTKSTIVRMELPHRIAG